MRKQVLRTASPCHDQQWVEAMITAGASGYALKDDPFAELVQAIRAVAAGQIYLSPALGPLGPR